ncbi:MAG: hypothetical protein LBS60_09085 [Deltaproteobacteria bacterium]|jgi:hypothetical protein|nr:hypothetical protein [Deltaproteobacteria bacterium]
MRIQAIREIGRDIAISLEAIDRAADHLDKVITEDPEAQLTYEASVDMLRHNALITVFSLKELLMELKTILNGDYTL